MEYWLHQHKWEVVASQHISIEKFAIPAIANTGPRKYEAGSGFRTNPAIDANLPHIICRFFKDAVSLRVLQTANKKQFFLFVRDNISATFAKKDLDELCALFLPLAPCVIVAGRISVKSLQAIRVLAQKYGNHAEVMNIADVTFDKMRSVGVPDYRALNAEEIHAIEDTKKVKATDFARILASDPIVVYNGFHFGQVLEKRDKRTGALSYRIVASSSGLLPQPKEPATKLNTTTPDTAS